MKPQSSVLSIAITCIVMAASASAVVAPDHFVMVYNTTVNKGHGSIIKFNITRSASPNGVDRLYELLTLPEGCYYNNNGMFRVVPDFVVQYGINGDPAVSAKWKTAYIPDDPVVLSNVKGTLAYAMSSSPNSRTTQLFINYADNSYLDADGFAPIGNVIEGFDVALDVNAEYEQEPKQALIYSQGNTYLEQNFPNLDYILTATIE
ncbi:cyclophilin type peptidyl-prolyl cis-trans isomerase [Pelomyxa schiedti]|nr:cyclophilin type peptidyl-prolyl cis-trans isomerase [Pelomyxa schiedti]